jgi:lipoprotein-anchoring transpeptidase ErfK/SrfK
MGQRTVQLVAALSLLSTISLSAAPQRRSAARARPPAKAAAKAKAPSGKLPCGDVLGFQIRLDRINFSPGQIDGKPGQNLTHALAAFQSAHRIKSSGALDCASWKALGGEGAGDLLTAYTLSAEDAAGPYQPDIPNDLAEQAKLPALAYQTVAERLGEKFHASPALIEQLNPRVTLAEGTTIKVPAVKPFDASVKPTPAANAKGVTVLVSKADSAAHVTGADGATIFFAPVTTGSEHDPLPTGDWKVTGVQWNPPFHYNPDLFWDAKPDDTKATIKPGPNNPVGVVWIDLDLEHYGLHGTPEPGNVGHTASHGCVRLTNWDAARLAALVSAGTPVQFR